MSGPDLDRLLANHCLNKKRSDIAHAEKCGYRTDRQQAELAPLERLSPAELIAHIPYLTKQRARLLKHAEPARLTSLLQAIHSLCASAGNWLYALSPCLEHVGQHALITITSHARGAARRHAEDWDGPLPEIPVAYVPGSLLKDIAETPRNIWLDWAEQLLGSPARTKAMRRFDDIDRGLQREEKQRLLKEQRQEHRKAIEELRAERVAQGLSPSLAREWVNQTLLYNLIKAAFPDDAVEAEASPEWLGRQRFDIFVPAYNLAVEYQGEQHYQPIECWGGADGLTHRQRLDRRKRDRCREAGVTLIEWKYNTPLSLDAVRERIAPVLSH